VVVKFTIKILIVNLVKFIIYIEKNIINLNKFSFFKRKACSSVDRASDSDSESQGFDSLHAYRFILIKRKNIILN
jgi:hypothetical protein